MDDEIGITADRGSEMRVAAQIETEMSVILDDIFGLRLGAQHDFIDEMLVFAAPHAGPEYR